MARRLAHKYRNRGENQEDLEQVAALGLMKAVAHYDPSRGAFESYAVPTILGEVKRHFRDNGWQLHVPRRVQELRSKVRASVQALDGELDRRSPTVAELAEHSGLSEEDVTLGLEALHCYRSLSLEAEIDSDEGGFSLLDTLGNEEPGFAHVVAREAVKPCLSRLPEREQRVLYLRFFRDRTQAQIAEELGLSQMHISRLLSRTCQRIREQIEADPDPLIEEPEQLPVAA